MAHRPNKEGITAVDIWQAVREAARTLQPEECDFAIQIMVDVGILIEEEEGGITGVDMKVLNKFSTFMAPAEFETVKDFITGALAVGWRDDNRTN